MKLVNPQKIPLQFRTWVGDKLTRISLVDGQIVRFHFHHLTDEGWRSEDYQFTRHGLTINFIHATDGRDCDGRHSTYWEGECHRDNLHSRSLGRVGRRLPHWVPLDSYQRDYEAEKAGY